MKFIYVFINIAVSFLLIGVVTQVIPTLISSANDADVAIGLALIVGILTFGFFKLHEVIDYFKGVK